MGYEALRDVTRGLMFGTYEEPGPLAVPATVTATSASPVQTAVIWLVGSRESPGDAVLQQQEERRLVAIRRDHVPAVPRGTLIACAAPIETDGPTLWEVDETVGTFGDHQRVAVRAADLST